MATAFFVCDSLESYDDGEASAFTLETSAASCFAASYPEVVEAKLARPTLA